MMKLIKITVLIVSFCVTASLTLAAENKVIATDNIKWGLLNPLRGDKSPKAADLWGDRTTRLPTGMLVKFNKGFSSPPHIHNITYRGVVIKGKMHNDDPGAAKMWLSPGSFWTQPAGEEHITAASGEENLIYLEIDSGPYLVKPSKEAFDNGEKPINIDKNNLVWLSADDSTWISLEGAMISYLWGDIAAANGSFVKIPAGFSGYIEAENKIKAVVIEGMANYKWKNEGDPVPLSPASFFSSTQDGKHYLSTDTEVTLYINSKGMYHVKM